MPSGKVTDPSKANINIAVVKRWIPNKNCNYNGFAYDTGEGFTPILNIDDDGDGNPDRNIDDDGDGIPDRNGDALRFVQLHHVH